MSDIAIDIAAETPPVTWAAGQLRAALRERDVSGARVRVLAPGDPGGTALPEIADAFAIVPDGDAVLVAGSTVRGLVYALTELAETARLSERDTLAPAAPMIQAPASRVRSMARFFCSEAEDKVWFTDEQGWCDYLTVLASNRFSRFSLNFGLQYNHPYYNRLVTDSYLHFAYPFLVDVPGTPVVAHGLPAAEQARNLAMLRFIGRECARRGLEFQLGLWTHGYEYGPGSNPSHPIRGISAATHAAYCRDALACLVAAIPELTGVTLRVHVEAGIPEGSYDFWQTVMDGLARADRGFCLDIHAKGTDRRMIDIAVATGLRVTVSPKFMAEHTGLPYHQAAVREREMPTGEPVDEQFALSEGSRRFLRYGYGDLLARDRRYDVMVRLWPGTQRVLLQGDPGMAAGYGRAASFCGMNGIEFFEPLSFKGRMGSGQLGGRLCYRTPELRPSHDWRKHEYTAVLWGRLAYDPAAAPETWLRALRHDTGAAAAACAAALSAVGPVLPLVTQLHAVSACNNTYWPELYDNMSIINPPGRFPYGYDADGASRFGDVPTFDPQLFANPKTFAAALMEGSDLPRYAPLQVAGWLDACAASALAACPELTGSPAVQRIVIDVQILAGLARFFAARFRSACFFELYLRTGLADAYAPAMAHYRAARAAWLDIAQVSAPAYGDDLAFGPQPWMRGSWADRLPAIDRDIGDLAEWYANDRARQPADEARARHALQQMQTWQGHHDVPVHLHAPDVTTPGGSFAIRLSGAEGAAAARLFHRAVNQAERWSVTEMTADDGGFHAMLQPAAGFPLQYYAEFTGPAGKGFAPGLASNLYAQPYWTAMPG